MNPDNPEQLMFGKYVCAQTRFNLTRERYGNRNTVVMSTKWNTQATFFATKGNLLQIWPADMSQL